MKTKRKREIEMAADEKLKKLEKVAKVKNPCRDENCSSAAQPNSIFCGAECLDRHVQESLKLLAQERNKTLNNQNKLLGFSDAGKSAERIVVFERKTGKLITGPLAPTESSLLTWLQRHPTFEVLQPGNSSKNSKQKSSSSAMLKTSALGRPRPLSNNKEDLSQSVSYGVTLKGQKKEPVVKAKSRVLKTRSDSLSSSADQKTKQTKTDLEVLRTKIQLELCDLLLMRSEGEVSSAKVKTLASDVEQELWLASKSSSSVYKQKSLSIVRLFKRSSSQDLCNRLLCSELKPHQLVQDLARYFRTEIVSRNGTNDPTTTNHLGLLPGLTDTTDRHGNHVFDVGCRICTGRPVAAGDPEHSQKPASSSHLSVSNLSNGLLLPALDREKENSSAVTGLASGARRELISSEPRAEIVPRPHKASPTDVLPVCSPRPIPSTDHSKIFSVSFPPSVASAVGSHDVGAPRDAFSPGLTVAEKTETVSVSNSVDARPMVNPVVDSIACGNSLQSPSHRPRLASRTPDESGEEFSVSGGQPLQKAPHDLSSPSSAVSKPVERSRSSSLASALESSTNLVWRGAISALDGAATMQAAAYRLSGSMSIVREVLPSTVTMMGRIAPQVVQQYLQKIREQHTATREIAIVCFRCHDSGEQVKYCQLFSYLQDKRRCGVVGSIGSLIKDMYIWPLPARTAIPTSILPSGDPGFESSRSNFLLGIIVQQARTNSAGSIKKPLATALPLDPLSSSQHSETDATTTQRSAEKEIVRIEGATTNDESSEEDDDDDFKAIADSDPIVSKYSKVKRNDVSLKAPAACDEDDEDKPYDPYEAEYELNTIGQVKTKVANEEIAKPNQKVMSESAGAALTAFPPSPDDFTAGNKVENSPLESIARLTFNPDASTDVLLAKKSVESSGSVSVSCEVEHGAVSGGAPSPQVENSVSGTTASSHNSESEKLDVDVVVITDTDEKPEEESSTAAKSISGELNDGETTRLIPETGILSAAVSIECQENVFYNNINDLSSILNKCRENSVAASSDGKPDPKTPALGEVALSDVTTDSSSCQVVPFSESFEESSGGIIKSSDVKEAISELFHVDVLNEESLRKYLDQLMQSRGARTNVDQQKILVELIETVEKASDLANSRTNGNREFSDGSQCDRAESSTDEKTDSEQFGESRNSKLFEDQSSRAGDSATSAVGAHFSIPEDFTDDNNRETYQTDINSLKQKEIPSSSSPELLLETRFSLPNSREKALSYSEAAEDVGKQPVASSAASCSSLSCSWKSQTASEIPSDISNINIENILPILSSSSVETLKTIVMSAKSVQNIGHAASTACPNSVPCHTPPILSGPVSSCAPSSRFRPRVANISNSFPQNDSGGPQRRFPPAPRCPPLFNRVGFPEHVTGLGHRRPPAFGPVCESELRFRRLPRPNAVRHLNSLSASGRNPHLARNQVPWQSHGMYGYYDDTVFHDGGAGPRSFRNLSVRMAGRFPNENQPFQHFGRPSSGREVPPFSRENSCGEKSRGSSRDPQGNSDAGYGFLSNSVASESDVYSSSDSSNKNLNGESSSSPLFVVQGDSAYPRLDDGEVEGRGILFDSACFENNFSDNSYEFFGSASDDNLEEFLPHMVPLSAADCLGKSTDVDTSSDPVLETVGDADGFADGTDSAKIPESDDQLCLDEFTAERTVDAPRNDINLRHANIEMCRRIQSGTVSTSDYPEHSRYPHSSFADDDWFGDRGHSVTAYPRHETGGDIGRMDMPGDRDRLYLRPNDRGGEIGSDLPEIRSLFSDPRGFRYYPDRPVPHSTDDGRSLERQQQSWQQDDGFSESRIHLGRDGYASGDQDGNTRLASSFQDSKNRRRKQNFSPNFREDHVKRRRLDEISHGDEWGQHHRLIDPGDGYDLPPRSSNRYDNFFEPASYQNSVGSSDMIELSSGRFSRPQVIDYGHRKRDFVTERGHQDLYDAQPTRPDITESSTYQYGAIPASHGRQIRLDERILHDHRRPLYEPALANRGADAFRTARMGISGLPYRDCDSYGDRSRCFQKSNAIFAPDADSNQTRSNFGERKRKVVGRSDSIVLPSPTKELLAFLKTRGATEPA